MSPGAAMPPPPADFEARQARLIAAEYRAARTEGTDLALRRFIERFPGHALALKAERELARRAKTPK